MQEALRAKATALAPTYQEGQLAPLSMDLTGTLRSTAGTGGGGSTGGLTNTELRATPVPVSGTVGVSGTVPVSGPLTDTQLRASAVPVSGAFFQATQPISAASLPLPTSAAQDRTTAAAPAAVRLTDGAAFFKPTTPADTQPVSGTFWQATQPVSGTVTANIGTSGSLALDATLTGGTARTKVTDGTTNAAVKAASTAAVAADPALVVAVSPNNTIPVSGTFWQATQPVSIAATVAENVSQWGGSATTLGQKAMTASVPVVLASDQSTIATKAFQAVTYTAIYRLASRPYALSNAFGAAGRKQYAVIYHAATATKLVKVKRVEVALESSSAAAIVMADLVRLTGATAPATGNPAITQSPQFPGDAVSAETVCLALPTTAGSEGVVHSFLEWNLGITGAASALNPPPALNWYTLWPQVQGAGEVPENKYPTMRAATAEGFAVTLDSNALSTVRGFVVIEFSEE